MDRLTDRIYRRLHRLTMPPGRLETPMDRWLVRLWTRCDVAFYRRFGWSAASRLMRVDVLLLETVGRRTGQRRANLVACLTWNGGFVVGGPNYGWDRDPGWLHNLMAEPMVRVTHGRDTQPMRALVLDAEAAVEVVEALAGAYPHSQAYAERRTRPIRVVHLRALDGTSSVESTN